MDYKETLEYLLAQLPMYYRIGPAAYKADLNNTFELLKLLKNPQNNFRSVHIAGTNGKGSVSHMLASILQTKGFKTGLYTSPHLQDFRERIKINGKPIPEQYVSSFVSSYKNDFEKLGLSFFEMTVGLAFNYFSDSQVEIAVIETGLGGRLDSTNVIDPLLSVITNISYDHMNLLGDTLEKIAFEKAGIIKPSTPVVIGETQNETKQVFTDKANETGSPVYFADSVYKIKKLINYYIDSKVYLKADIIRNERLLLKSLLCPLTGLYQSKNILTTLQSIEILNQSGFKIQKHDIKDGIRNVIKLTGLMGRWQTLSEKPLIICDVGHNEGGLTEVVRQIELTPHDKLHFVFGMVNDKESDKILSILPGNATYYFCKANIPRGLDASLLKEKAHNAGLKGESYNSVKDAIYNARLNASVKDLIFIGGSVFIVGEALNEFKNI